MRPAVRRQQPVHQRLQPIGLVDDDLGVFLQVARLDLHLQQLGRAADAAQRILDLVRQVADQLLVGLGLVDQPLLAVLLGLRLQRQHFDDELAGPVGLRHDHVHRQRLAVVLAHQPGVVAQGRELVAGRAFQRVLQQLRLVKQWGKLEPSMVRREVPRASSSAELANSTVPSPATTATSVASRSSDWKRAGWGAGGFKPSF